jgi:N-acetylglucosamine kinase-like BadF-type ATPase
MRAGREGGIVAIYVIGVDIGGSSTRVAVAGATGDIIGTGRAGGGNPVTHGPATATAELTQALRQALRGVDPTEVTVAVIGMAGVGPASRDPAARAAFAQAWRAAGLTCHYELVPDPLVAFASGTGAPDGTVVIAGTGAVACAVRGYAVQRLADGHGWLLGDRGSGFWLGREAARATLADLDRQDPLSELSVLVLTEILGSAEVADPPRATVSALVGAVNAGPPIALARLAPLVSRAHAAGDRAASAIVARAADALADTLDVIRPAGADTPIVLGGGLLVDDASPVAAALRERLAARWPAATPLAARDGAAGAARLAARAAGLPGARVISSEWGSPG